MPRTQSTPQQSMPTLPRLATAAGLLAWANGLVNVLEIQMRRLTAQPTISTVPAVGQTATGTNQATAFQISSTLTIFTTVAAGTGAAVPAVVGAGLVVNGGANTLTLYAASGGTVNGGASVTIAAGAQRWWSVDSPTVAFAN